MTSIATSNRKIVLGAIEAINRRDWDAVRAVWSSNVEERFPDQTVRGAQALTTYFQRVVGAFPDLRVDVKHTAEECGSVFVRHEISGTHTGAPFNGVNATGKTVRIPGIDHFIVRDGKIVSNFVVFDQMDFARQLGLLPPEGSGLDRALKALFNMVTATRGASSGSRARRLGLRETSTDARATAMNRLAGSISEVPRPRPSHRA